MDTTQIDRSLDMNANIVKKKVSQDDDAYMT